METGLYSTAISTVHPTRCTSGLTSDRNTTLLVLLLLLLYF